MSKKIKNTHQKKKSARHVKKQFPLIVNEKRKFNFQFLTKWWVVLLGIISLLGAIPTYNEIKEKYFTSETKKYEDNNFVEGKISPYATVEYTESMFNRLEVKPIFSSFNIKLQPAIHGIRIKFDENGLLYFYVAGYYFWCPKNILENGISLHLPNACDSISVLSLISKQDRLYVSCQFNDLQKEEYVGSMDYDHWRLFKPNLLDFQSDKDGRFLQVEDRQNNVIFSIHYWKNSTVFIAGYFITPTSIIVIPNNLKRLQIHPYCIDKSDPNWKQKALQEIIWTLRVDTVHYPHELS